MPVVLVLANPPWQRDVWLDPSAFEDLNHVFHTLFDDFCDADEPERYLGVSLRSDEEVALMRELGAALNAAGAEAPNDIDAEYLPLKSWSRTIYGNLPRCLRKRPCQTRARSDGEPRGTAGSRPTKVQAPTRHRRRPVRQPLMNALSFPS